jgi:predicted site-specific integrase-resolvase
MPRIVRGTKYYRTAEACETAGISKNTFFRWLRCGEFEDVSTADRHGWRLFSETDLERLCEKAQHISSRELVGIP